MKVVSWRLLLRSTVYFLFLKTFRLFEIDEWVLVCSELFRKHHSNIRIHIDKMKELSCVLIA